MTTVRKRRPPMSGLVLGEDLGSDETTEKERVLAFSDDEDEGGALTIQNGSTSSVIGKNDHVMQPDFPCDIISESTVPSQFSAEGEVDGDVDIFNKAINITNLNEVDHAELLRRMHGRFKKKVKKWEAMALMYSRYSFAMNFTILILQLFQMILHQFANMWTLAEKELLETTKGQNKSFFHSIGIYRISEWKNASGSSELGKRGLIFGAIEAILSPNVVKTIHGLLTALTAVLAGLQLKLKLSQKSERYRRGAKVYGRLLRISTYYIMLIESGGKLDDITGLWREAMKKEGKWIPLVRTYMPI